LALSLLARDAEGCAGICRLVTGGTSRTGGICSDEAGTKVSCEAERF
jgi:hypothetical protein